MIRSHKGEWSRLSKIEEKALAAAHSLLPESDNCIYIGFPWVELCTMQDPETALRELIPKRKPGQRVLTVCESLNNQVKVALVKLGVTDVFVPASSGSPDSKGGSTQTFDVHLLKDTCFLWFNEVLAFVNEHSEYAPSSSFRQKLVGDVSVASGAYEQSLSYLLALTESSKPQDFRPKEWIKKKLFLFGPHSHRTPLSYSHCQYPLMEYFDIAGSLDDADVIVTGNRVDYIRNADIISNWYKRKTKPEIYVISEEPYWDTMWDKEFDSKHSTRNLAGTNIMFKRVNHITSDLYKWQHVPYYITTNNLFFSRYAALFRRNAKFSADDWLQHWSSCRYPTAFIAEKRNDDSFNVSFPDLDIQSYCVLRSLLAEESMRFGGFVEGRGWFKDSVIRQSLDDWHLDKLSKLDMSARIVSAIENTHHIDYVTEKLFDAYAVGGIPIYSANPKTHSVWRLVSRNSLINLYGLGFEQSKNQIFEFIPDKAFANEYAKTQVKLAELFSKPWLLWHERKRIAGDVGRLIYN